MHIAQLEQSFYVVCGSLGVRGVARARLDRSCALLLLGVCSAHVPWQSPDVMLQELCTMSDVQLACAMLCDVCESCLLLKLSKKLLSVVRIFRFWLDTIPVSNR